MAKQQGDGLAATRGSKKTSMRKKAAKKMSEGSRVAVGGDQSRDSSSSSPLSSSGALKGRATAVTTITSSGDALVNSTGATDMNSVAAADAAILRHLRHHVKSTKLSGVSAGESGGAASAGIKKKKRLISGITGKHPAEQRRAMLRERRRQRLAGDEVTVLRSAAEERMDTAQQELRLFETVAQVPEFIANPFISVMQHLNDTMDVLRPMTADVGRAPLPVKRTGPRI